MIVLIGTILDNSYKNLVLFVGTQHPFVSLGSLPNGPILQLD